MVVIYPAYRQQFLMQEIVCYVSFFVVLPTYRLWKSRWQLHGIRTVLIPCAFAIQIPEKLLYTENKPPTTAFSNNGKTARIALRLLLSIVYCHVPIFNLGCALSDLLIRDFIGAIACSISKVKYLTKLSLSFFTKSKAISNALILFFSDVY